MAGFDVQGMIGKLIGTVQKNPSILSDFKSNPMGALSQVLGGTLDGDSMGSLLSGLVNQAGSASYADGISADGLLSALQGGGGGAELSGLLGGLADENKNGIPDVLEGVSGGAGGGLGGGLLADKDKDGVPDMIEGVLGDGGKGGLGGLVGGLLGGKDK